MTVSKNAALVILTLVVVCVTSVKGVPATSPVGLSLHIPGEIEWNQTDQDATVTLSITNATDQPVRLRATQGSGVWLEIVAPEGRATSKPAARGASMTHMADFVIPPGGTRGRRLLLRRLLPEVGPGRYSIRAVVLDSGTTLYSNQAELAVIASGLRVTPTQLQWTTHDLEEWKYVDLSVTDHVARTIGQVTVSARDLVQTKIQTVEAGVKYRLGISPLSRSNDAGLSVRVVLTDKDGHEATCVVSVGVDRADGHLPTTRATARPRPSPDEPIQGK